MTLNSAYVGTTYTTHSVVEFGYVEGFWIHQDMEMSDYMFDQPMHALLIDAETNVAVVLGKIGCQYTIIYETGIYDYLFMHKMFLGEKGVFETIDGTTYETAFHGSFSLDQTEKTFGNRIYPDNCLSSLKIPWLKVKRI